MAKAYFARKNKNGVYCIPLYVMANGKKYGPIEISVDVNGMQLRSMLEEAGYISKSPTVKLYYNTEGGQKEISNYDYRSIKEWEIMPNSVIYARGIGTTPMWKKRTYKTVFVKLD